jgi:MoaA/NifB/PqqE/SkfB family radical SAM enzyme
MKIYKKNLASYTNFLTLKYKRSTGAPKLSSLPYFISVDPSSICNLKCPFCPTGIENFERGAMAKGFFRKRELMSPEVFGSVLDELGEYLFIINFYNWGEPLLNKSLPAMVRRAKGLDIFTQIHSNLSLRLSEGYIDELLSSGMDEICLSIDGITQEVYEKYRRGGELSLVLDNLERMVAIRDKLGLGTSIEWGFLVFSFNQHQMGDIKRRCRELGISFRPRNAHIDTEKQPDWVPGMTGRLRTLLDKPRVPLDEMYYRMKKMLGERYSRDRSCIWHYGQSIINSDGSVSPCCALQSSKDDFGIVAPTSRGFNDVWNNEKFMSARMVSSPGGMTGHPGLDTVCGRCANQYLKNLYSSYEYFIIKRFMELYGSSEPLLAQAFKLLNSRDKFVRYFREIIMPELKGHGPG